jgi:hypothetical protein
MYIPVEVAHSSFIEGSHTTKNTASVLSNLTYKYKTCLKGPFFSAIFSRFEPFILRKVNEVFYQLCLQRLRQLSCDKHSSLFICGDSDEEKKF